jgi:hypothetical protein
MFSNIFGMGGSAAQQMRARSKEDDYNDALRMMMQQQMMQQQNMVSAAPPGYNNKKRRKLFAAEIEVVGNGYTLIMGEDRLIAKDLEELSAHIISHIAAAQLED